MKDLVSGIRYDASNVISQAIGPSKGILHGIFKSRRCGW